MLPPSLEASEHEYVLVSRCSIDVFGQVSGRPGAGMSSSLHDGGGRLKLLCRGGAYGFHNGLKGLTIYSSYLCTRLRSEVQEYSSAVFGISGAFEMARFNETVSQRCHGST